MNYTAQLLDPRWKAKRKQILTRDRHTCTNCGTQKKLHVHHIQYTGMAWEAPSADLTTLCSACHKAVHHKVTKYGDFMMIYKSHLRYVSISAPETLPTLNALIWLNDIHNIVLASHEKLAQETNTSLPTIARHMRRFRDLGVVLNDIEVPRACYRVHPLLVWKGDSKSRDVYIAGLGSAHPFIKLINQLDERNPKHTVKE